MLRPSRRAASPRAAVPAADRGEAGTVTFAYAGASTRVVVGVLAREVRMALPGIEFLLYSQDFALPALAWVLGGEVDVSRAGPEGAGEGSRIDVAHIPDRLAQYAGNRLHRG